MCFSINHADRAATAHHEAGHAVAAVVLGLPVDRASIIPNQTEEGSVRLRSAILEPDLELTFYVAGYLAEQGYRRRHALGDELGFQGSRRDFALVRHALKKRYWPDLHTRICRQAIDAAEKILKDHRSAVDFLANDLLRHTELSGSAVASIVHRMNNNQHFRKVPS